jgi:DNA modification methylase
MESDLSFKGVSTSHTGHNLHAFAAKFPPQLPRAFILELTEPGERVLDPMVGSGTALVEAAMAGRVGIGIDFDPLAVRICRAKTALPDPQVVEELADSIADYAQIALATGGPDYYRQVLHSFSPQTRQFIEYWFLPSTTGQLGALAAGIAKLTPWPYRGFFEVLLSSIVITKSGGVSLARDLAHSRPHKVTDKKIKDAVQVFRDKAAKSVFMLEELRRCRGTAHVIRSDSRCLPLPGESVDLVVTSPPYANAIDYVRAHKFSLVWLGYDIERLTQLRRRLIGAEVRLNGTRQIKSATGQETLREIRERDPRRADIIRHYFEEMTCTLTEMHRVLRAGRSAVVVVGSSVVRSVVVPTALILAEIGEQLGFHLVAVTQREIDRDRRLMPISRQSDERGIEARMHREHVIALVKPA